MFDVQKFDFIFNPVLSTPTVVGAFHGLRVGGSWSPSLRLRNVQAV